MATRTESSLIELKDYEGRYNVLFPQSRMTQISPYHRIRVEEVKINPDPEAGDVFKVGTRKVGDKWEDVLSLSKTAILKIATAAGIVWNWNETRPITATKDYVLYQAVGAMRKPSGEWIPLKATKEIDLEVIEAETYEANLKKAESMTGEQRKGMTPEQWAEVQTKANMMQWKKNKLMRAETGAMLRVVRALLSIKHHYSPGELNKPFAVPTVDFTPDYSDPEVKRMIAAQSLKAASDLFGQETVQQLTPGQMEQPIDAGAFQKQGQQYLGSPTEAIDVNGEADGFDEDLPPDIKDEEFPWEENEQRPPGPHQLDTAVICRGCHQPVLDAGTWTADQIVEYSLKTFGRELCLKCQGEAREKAKAAKSARGGGSK